MFSIHQPWDPLRSCIVGRSFPPEFYSWIKVPHVRSLFERIAVETEEDLERIAKILGNFGVKVLRPDLPEHIELDPVTGRYPLPPMVPRDYMIMVGDRFYSNTGFDWQGFYQRIRDSSWPDFDTVEAFLNNADAAIVKEAREVHELDRWIKMHELDDHAYRGIHQHVRDQGNVMIPHCKAGKINGAMVTRIGRDLYFGTSAPGEDTTDIKRRMDQEFSAPYRNHVVETDGHSDATFCPVTPGLIISLYDIPTYADTFPGWEVVYLPGQSWDAVKPFLDLKRRNRGRWWIPGFEYDAAVTEVVETWLNHWTGYVEETVFDVNMLVIDPKNVIVSNHNNLVFKALDRYGITAHVAPLRHRYFWDGGIHCVTADLDRDGVMQDYFAERK